jgi:hypothetical protein
MGLIAKMFDVSLVSLSACSALAVGTAVVLNGKERLPDFGLFMSPKRAVVLFGVGINQTGWCLD